MLFGPEVEYVHTDLALMDIHKVIIHEVPRHARHTKGGGPILSEIESPLDADLKLYLRERIVGSLMSSQAFDVVIDPIGTSPVPGLISHHTAAGAVADFVAISQHIARHLYSIQGGANPAGLLAIIDCSVASARGLAILKLEKEKGARINQEDVGGKKTYNIRIVRDLILTEKTKVFKVGIFFRTGEQPDGFDAAASDHQRGLFHRMEVADFFLKQFLGCKLTEEPEISTKRFFEVTEQFINEQVEDAVRRARYHNHLVSVLTSEQPTVSPRRFAEDFLRTSDRQKFLGFIESKQLPSTTFRVDTSLVKSRLEKVEYRFRDGVSIVTPADANGGRVKLSNLESGEVRAEVVGFLDAIRGKG